MQALAISYDSRTAEHSSFIPGRVARLSINNVDLAYIGEINPKVLENWGITMPTACFELNLTEIYKILITLS